MFGDLGKLMKQAQAFQEKMGSVREEMAALRVEGEAGAGMVRVTLDGAGALQAVSIDPSLLKPDEAEILEDLLVAAHANAKVKVEQVSEQKMREAAGGLPLPPGMKLPF